MKLDWAFFKTLLEYLGGERDAPPDGVRLSTGSVLWGVWWTLLLAIVIVFCGQSSKFIYIDF